MRAGLIAITATLGFLSSAALAADLPNTKGPPAFAPPPPPVFSWTGFYVGAQVGYEWGTSDPIGVFNPTNAFAGVFNSYSDQGVVGGLHAGYNYQVSQFVFGMEGDVEGSSYNGSGITPPPICGPACNLSTRSDIQGSVRGRIGWAWDRVLIYGTGGAAFASIRNSLVQVASDAQDFGRIGWTAGGGIEYALDPNWSVRVEYRYTDFGAYDLDLINTTGGFLSVRERERDNRAEAGFSYKFDMFAPPAPVVAKY
jgi:outer membrane immunogenic protein